jgi:molybdenum-dependent DNA-binding transcriptional regulator ModE
MIYSRERTARLTSRELAKLALELLDMGMTIPQAARRIGVSYTRVHKALVGWSHINIRVRKAMRDADPLLD